MSDSKPKAVQQPEQTNRYPRWLSHLQSRSKRLKYATLPYLLLISIVLLSGKSIHLNDTQAEQHGALLSLDDFKAGADAFDAQQQQHAGATLFQGVQTPAAQTAQARETGNLLGVPSGVVALQQPDMDLLAKIQTIRDNAAYSPRLREWLAAHPDNVSLAQDAGPSITAGDIIAFLVLTGGTYVLLTIAHLVAYEYKPWWERSKLFRLYCFLAGCWAVGFIIFVELFNPYHDSWDYLHMFSVALVPPVFIGIAMYLYLKFISGELQNSLKHNHLTEEASVIARSIPEVRVAATPEEVIEESYKKTRSNSSRNFLITIILICMWAGYGYITGKFELGQQERLNQSMLITFLSIASVWGWDVLGIRRGELKMDDFKKQFSGLTSEYLLQLRTRGDKFPDEAHRAIEEIFAERGEHLPAKPKTPVRC